MVRRERPDFDFESGIVWWYMLVLLLLLLLVLLLLLLLSDLKGDFQDGSNLEVGDGDGRVESAAKICMLFLVGVVVLWPSTATVGKNVPVRHVCITKN